MTKIKINMDAFKSNKKTERIKIEDGSNILRFLPPYGEQSNGYPYQKYSVIWGLRDPNTGNTRPYLSTYMFEGECPVFQYLDALKAKVDKMTETLRQKGLSEEKIRDYLKDTTKFMSDIKPKTAYAWNAVEKSGKVGIVELKTTAHKKLCKLMNDYVRENNQDPTSLNSDKDDSGLWFNITRTGKNFNTEYDVFKYQVSKRTPEGTIYLDDRSPLPEAVVADFESYAYDLTTIYNKKSYNELKDILIANLSHMIQTNPHLKIDGWYIADAEPMKEATPKQDIVTKQEPQVQRVSKPMPKIEEFDDVSDEDDYVAPKLAPKPVQKVQPIAKPMQAEMSDEDIINMADELFN